MSLNLETEMLVKYVKERGETYKFPPGVCDEEEEILDDLLDFCTRNMEFCEEMRALRTLVAGMSGNGLEAVRHTIEEAICISECVAMEVLDEKARDDGPWLGQQHSWSYTLSSKFDDLGDDDEDDDEEDDEEEDEEDEDEDDEDDKTVVKALA